MTHPSVINQFESQIQKNHMDQAIRLIDQFDKISNDIQSILSTIVKAHQKHILFCFKQQMCKVKEQLKDLERQIDVKNKKIQYYQSEAAIGQLQKQVLQFQKQQAKLFLSLKKKNLQIKDLKIQVKISKSQNRRLQQKLKQLIRSKIKDGQNQQQSIQNQQPESTFSTQILPFKISSLDRKTKEDKSVRKNNLSKKEKPFYSCNTINIDKINLGLLKKYETENKKYKLQNCQQSMRQLKKQKIIEQQPIRQFIVEIVNEMKQKINIKRKLKKCSLQDFKKQDKYELLLTIISNQQLLTSLYQVIFNRKQTDDPNNKKNSISTCRKISATRSILARNAFPCLHSANTDLNKLEQV